MKKSLIAASASAVALAAMPVVGVFATDLTTQTDTLEITIGPVCSFGYTDDLTPTHVIDVAEPSHTDGTSGTGPGTWDDDTLSADMLNGTSNSDLGKTTLNVYCNNVNGYNITTGGTSTDPLTVGALNGAASGESIPVSATFATPGTTGWSYIVEAATGNRGEVKGSHDSWATPANATGIIAGSLATGTKTTSNRGDSFTVTYGVGINETLSADTYSGSITYTLVQL